MELPDAMQSWQHSPPAWLPLLPLVLLPVTGIFSPHEWLARVALLIAAISIWGWMLAGAKPGEAPPVLAATTSERRVGGWALILLGVVVAAAATYFVVGWRLTDIMFNDGAYYYGVARHMARTGRFEEPIVWHFLYLPETVPHAPFDYWGCMTSLLLLGPMLVFGATLTTAFLTMSAIAGLTLLAFWYLVCVALPLRYGVTQLLAVVLFAFTPAMDVYRFQPESIPVAHLFIVLALVAFCRRWSVAAVLCGFAILLTRGDGLILFFLIVLAALFREWKNASGRQLVRTALAAGACMAVYVLWSIVSFGTLTPPAPQVLPFMPAYRVVFDFNVPHERTWRQLLEWLTWPYLQSRFYLALYGLRQIPFTPFFGLWLAIAMLPVATLFRLRELPRSLIWILCFGGYFFVAWVSGPGFAPGRAPYTFTPLFILAGAVGLDTLLTWLQVRSGRGRYVRAEGALLGAGALVLAAVFLVPLPVLQQRKSYPNLNEQKNLTLVAPVLGEEPVATNVPWYMIAYTDSPTISIPLNGEAAIEAALDYYQIRWIVLWQFPFNWNKAMQERAKRLHGVEPPHPNRQLSWFLLEDILARKRARIGRFELVQLKVPGVIPAVYRVELARNVMPPGSTF